MTGNAGHDGLPQAGNAHLLRYQASAKVLMRPVGVEEVPAPLVAEICYRLGQPIVEDGIVRPYDLATLLNAGVEDKLIISVRAWQEKMLIEVS
jgi:hypothetical protein